VTLAALQAAFQAAIMAGRAEDPAIVGALSKPAAADRKTAFGVYVGAYRLRLSEYLQEDYGALRALIGEKRFRALVEDYIVANPSRSRNARYYSSRLPEFMRGSAKWRNDARAVAIAALERALSDAFDAADAAPCSLETLAAFSAQDWPRLAFAFHPSLSMIEAPAGAAELYGALTAEERGDLPPPGKGTEIVAVWRSGFDPSYRTLDSDEHLALNEARAGKSFGDICQLVAFQGVGAAGPERLAQFLVNWFSEGLVVGVSEVGDADAEPETQTSNTPSIA
jgi:hypothetical protein